MIGDINLIPQTEVVEQKKTEAVKTSTVVSIVVLVLSITIGAYFLIMTSGINNQISGVNKDITALRGQITALSQVEISARNLDRKYGVLKTLFSGRSQYSLLLQEIKSRQPSDQLSIESLDVKLGQASIAGNAENYVAIASFINNIVNKNFEGGNPKLKELFTTVTLNSVSLDKATNQVKYFILVSFDESKLKQ